MLGLLLFLPLCLVTAQESCLSDQNHPYLLFGTKTAYIFADRNIPSTRVHEVPGCEPAAIWLLIRHGAHNPEANEIEELSKLGNLRNNTITNYANGNFRNTNQRICNKDLNSLEQWEWNSRITSTFAGDLTTEGYMNTQQLAQAWKQKFPGLFTGNQHDYLFKFATDQRSSNTFKAFTEGIFGAQAESLNLANENDEKVLLPYKFCPVWQRDVEGNNSTDSQQSIFESKQEFKEMISNISLRLGFNYDMQKEIVLRMYQMCRYNKAWDINNVSAWCTAFTREDLKRLEYAEDLETYYKYGYGSAVNKDIGCTQVKDMMNFLEKHATDAVTPQQPRALIQFSSAAMLLLTLTAMGAYKDVVPLTSDNYHSPNVQGRKWTTSTIAPFSANLAAVLYKCTQNGNFQVREPYQVLFLENERPIYLEGCRVGLCDWSLVKHRYQELVKNCDLQFCNGASRLTGLAGIGFAAIVIIINHVMNRI